MHELAQDTDWDVIIIGGGLSGAATAIRALERQPELKILIVDREATTKPKIGESTVEFSAYFLGRTLNLTEYLTKEHVIKQGLRFWFAGEASKTVEDCSEIGPGYHVNLPSYQVDRAVLDEELLRRARSKGASVLRPARVTNIELNKGERQKLTLQDGDVEGELTARWVIDASGPACVLARQEKWIQPNERHTTNSIWARFQGVKNLDDARLRERFPEFSKRCHGSRNTATNHIMGDGWWSWWILLKSGEVSVGVVYDKRLVSFPNDVTSKESKMFYLLEESPLAKELLSDADLVGGSTVYRGNLAYSCGPIAGDGYVMVGDAAGFIDPFYSPGMDWIAYTTAAAVELITCEKKVSREVSKINRIYKRSFKRWFEALYENKYYYLGDYDFMRVAIMLDLGGYYLGVVRGLYLRGNEDLCKPVFGDRSKLVPFWIVRFYHRRLVKMAASRRQHREFGKNNHGKMYPIMSYTLDWRLPLRLLWNLRMWFWLELKEGWRTWFRPLPKIRMSEEEEK